MRKTLAVFLTTALLAACGHGANSMLPAAKQNPPAPAGTGQATVTIVVPSHVPASARRPAYISALTKGFEVIVYASSDAAHSKPLADATIGVNACTSVPSGEQCTVTLAAPAGTDDIVLNTYDQAPGANGAIPSSAHLLSTGTAAAQTIVANRANAIGLTLNPVVASIQMRATDATGGYYAVFTAGTPSTAYVALTLTDAAGMQIVAPGNLVDANGAPVTITLSTSDTTYGAPKTTTLAQTSITQPLSGSIALSYNGGHDESTLVTAASSSSLIAGATTTIPVNLSYTSYAAPFQNAYDIALGSDGAVWTSWIVSDGTSYIGRTDTSTGAFTSYPLAGAMEEPTYMALGADGNIYYSDHGGAFASPNGLQPNIGVVTPSGHITTMTMPTITDTSGNTVYPIPGYITSGPQNSLWFVTQDSETVSATGVTSPLIGRVTTSGTNQITYLYPWKSLGGPVQGICAAPDGALWISVADDYPAITPQGFWRIGNPTPPSASTIDFYPTNEAYSSCITGPDGKLYAVGSDSIARITMPATVEEFRENFTNQGSIPPLAGPDGRIWISSSYGGLYFVDPATASFVTPYPGPGAPAGGGAKLVLDRSGNIWTYYTGNVERIAW